MPILDQIAKAKKILILGFAREGQSTHAFLKKQFPNLQIDTADAKDGLKYLDNLKAYPIIVKTPGIPPRLPEIVQAKKNGVVFTSHLEIFWEVSPSKKIIGVTGTKGKSTTASLIHHVLSQNKISSILIGNIGKAALDSLLDITSATWVVIELSSYQLMDLRVSPHIAVLQNIYPDHLDYHQDFEEYKNAKLNITKFQTPSDYLITQLDVPTNAKKIIFSLDDFDQDIKTNLLGEHNKLNIIPAIKIGQLLELSEEKIYEAISTFKPLETRLENCGTYQGITFYADTLATIPEATMAAIDTLHPTTLIAGGHERHQNYQQLAQKIIDANIQTLILFPNTGGRIWEEIAKTKPESKIYHFEVASMEEAVRLAYKQTPANSVCLLSPAAPSFTLFKDYKDELEQFKKYILLDK